MKPWTAHGKKIVARTPIFTLTAEEMRAPRGGRRQTFYFLHAPDWINVVPVDERGRAIMIRQHRYGSRRFELEIPGGAMNPGERHPLRAAQRELREETGYVARRWIKLGDVNPNPAFQRNRLHLYLALGCRKAGAQQLDYAEEIDVKTIPVARLPGLVTRGVITHALVIAALYWLLARPELLRAPRKRRAR